MASSMTIDIGLISGLILGPLIVSALAAFVLSPIVSWWYARRRWLDDPLENNHDKVLHTVPVPRGGGVVIGLTVILGIWHFIGLDKHSVGIIIGTGILMFTGLVDDIKNTNPYGRLGLGFLAALAVVLSGIGIGFVTNPLTGGIIDLSQPQLVFELFGATRSLWILADIFALVWIVWCMNMVNWSKGLDGQLPGIVIVAAIVIGLLSLRFAHDVTQWNVTLLAAVTAGAYMGFLPWNLYPQTMMPGYGGGAIAGYLLAVLSILSGAKLATLILVLGIPMVDAVYVMLARIKRGESPVWGDRNHFHHKLIDLGWSKPKIAVFYWSMSLMLGLIALQLNPRQKAFTIALVALIFIGALLWIRSLTIFSRPPDPDNGSKT